jgi:hypothetical protein
MCTPLICVDAVAVDEIADIAIVFFLFREKSIVGCIYFDLIVSRSGDLVFFDIRLLEGNEFGFRSS